MPENPVKEITVHSLPTELLYHIFFCLPPKELMKCRQICKRWKLIIDGLARKDSFWLKYCKRDYHNYYLIAKKKAPSSFTWYNLYRSLSLWPRLPYAAEECDEFASASRLIEEVRSVDIVGDGVIAVHTRGGVEFYDIETLKPAKRARLTGDYARFTEDENYIVIQSYQLNMYIIRKTLHAATEKANNATFENVKLYLLADHKLYFVKLTDEIYVCDLTKEPIVSKFVIRAGDQDGVMSMGYSNNKSVNILTYQRNIYTIVNNKDLVLKQTINSESKILDVLHKYNLLEQLDWRVYFQWMYVLNHTVPESPMRDIIVIKPYGDIFLVGTGYGVLCIFYEPFINGELDLFNTEPLRQINFMQRSDIPVLATCPILQIDVHETEDGHTVFVAMPKKVAVLKFTHSFMNPVSWAILPYDEYHRPKFINVESIVIDREF